MQKDYKYKVSVLYLKNDSNHLNVLNHKWSSDVQDHVQIIEKVVQHIDYKNKVYNEFIDEAEGEFLTVIHEKDSYQRDYLKAAYETLTRNKFKEIQLGMCAATFRSEFETKLDDFSNSMYEKNIVIHTLKDYTCLPLHFEGVFVKSDLAKKYKLNEKLGLEAEKNLFLRIVIEIQEFLYMGGIEYNYSEPKDENYRTFSGIYRREWYYAAITDFLLPLLEENKEKVPIILQYFSLYFLQCRLNANVDNRNRHVVEEKDVDDYIQLFHKVLVYIDYDVLLDIYTQYAFKPDVDIKKMLLGIKENNFTPKYEYVSAANTLFLTYQNIIICSSKNTKVCVHFIEYENGKWEMDCSVPSRFPKDVVTYFVELSGKRYDVKYDDRYSMTKYFGRAAYKRITFHVSVPIDPNKGKQSLLFKMEYHRKDFDLPTAYDSHTSRLTKVPEYAYWRFDKFIAYDSQNEIIIRKASKQYTLYRELRVCKEMLFTMDPLVIKQLWLRLIYLITTPFYAKKKIWLFYDKIYKGGDSAEYMYKYADKQPDGIKKYYLLDKNVPDYRRLKREGYTPLKRDSLKHKLVFLNADIAVISNSTIFAFHSYTLALSGYIRGLTDFHVMCVQHGLSVQKIAVAQQRLRDNTRLYFCASKYEIENLSKDVYNYTGYNALKLTGVPRYDGLINEDKKQILLAPTWRMQSAMLVNKNESVERDYNPLFKETDYYKVYNRLINDERLITTAKQYGYRIAYVLHPIVSMQAEDFDENDYVDIIPATSGMSYEKLFRESSLMVSDYSGVQFDFAYMRKPLVYLHHDDIPQHYEEGTFHYDTMAFGEICHNNSELVNILCDYMKDGCKMKDLYRKRADDFFAFNDHNNCARIYDEMIIYQNKINTIRAKR